MTKRALSRGNHLTVSKLWDYFNNVTKLFGRHFEEICRGKVVMQHVDIVSRSKKHSSGSEHCISFSANGSKFGSPWGTTQSILFFTIGVVSALAKTTTSVAYETVPKSEVGQGFGMMSGPVDKRDQQIEKKNWQIAEYQRCVEHEAKEKAKLLQTLDQAASFLLKAHARHSE